MTSSPKTPSQSKKRLVMARKTRESNLAYAAEWYAKNIARERAKRKAYYYSHKEEARQYASDNKERISAQQRERNKRLKTKKQAYNQAYYAGHREELIAAAGAWNRAHPEKVAAKSKAQHARKKGNGGSYTASQWLALKAQYNHTCLGCKLTEPEIIALGRTLAADHVIPIAKGGTNDISNIQPLCHGKGGCNLKKAAKHIDYRRAA